MIRLSVFAGAFIVNAWQQPTLRIARLNIGIDFAIELVFHRIAFLYTVKGLVVLTVRFAPDRVRDAGLGH